jgi:hypothetical protein
METKLITLAQLLLQYPPAVLVRAIERHGLYGWDQYGIWGEFKHKSEAAGLALGKLSEVYYAIVESTRHDPPKSWHSVLTGKNLIGPLHHLGWLHGQLPDFRKIENEMSSAPSFIPISGHQMRDSTSLAIIGALLQVVRDQPIKSEQGKPLTQSEIIVFLTKHYAGYPGVKKSTLENVFGKANAFVDTYTGLAESKKTGK